MKSKILLFIKTPPPITGATLMNQRVYDSKILRESFNLSSICISYAKNTSKLGKINIYKAIKVIQVYLRLLKEMVFNKPGLVYFQLSPLGTAFFRDLCFVTLIRLFKVPIVFHLHGKGIKEAVKSKGRKILYEYTFRRQKVISVSKLLAYDIEDVYSDKVYIVNNGLPDSNINRTVYLQKLKSNKPQLLFLSNLFVSKGIIDYLDALELLIRRGTEINGVIIGGEGDISSKTILSEIERRGLHNLISYMGPKYGEEKNRYIEECDMLIFPTKNDIWGNVILEAMQFAKPVVATREGAIPEIIDDGITGFLVDKSSPEQIAEKIQLLIENPELRRSMGIAARKKYEEKYTLNRFEENMKNVFDQILAKANQK